MNVHRDPTPGAINAAKRQARADARLPGLQAIKPAGCVAMPMPTYQQGAHRMADIGEPQKYVEFEPIPTTVPAREPAPVVEPEKVPA